VENLFTGDLSSEGLKFRHYEVFQVYFLLLVALFALGEDRLA
jgi:hypothetical protein